MNKFLVNSLVGLAAGLFSGLLGIGGGIVLIPFMVSYLKLDQKKAQGTSLLVFFPLALAASLGYGLSGNIKTDLALQLAIGSMLGIYVGASLAFKLPSKWLTKSFGIIMLLAALKMFWR